MTDGILAVEQTKSSSAKAPKRQSAKARKSAPRIPPRRGRRHGPNTEYAPGYGHTGAVIRQVEISIILERLDKAFRTARRIDARQRKLEAGRDGRHSPTFRLAGVIKGIYNTLDRAHGHAQYVHDVRMKLIPVIPCVPNLTGYRSETPAAKPAPQAAADVASKVAAPAVLKQEVVHG
jgi:hypothetical protein